MAGYSASTIINISALQLDYAYVQYDLKHTHSSLLLTLSRCMVKIHHDLSRFLGVFQGTSLTSSLYPALYLASHG